LLLHNFLHEEIKKTDSVWFCLLETCHDSMGVYATLSSVQLNVVL
jgi:hypothetical protein